MVSGFPTKINANPPEQQIATRLAKALISILECADDLCLRSRVSHDAARMISERTFTEESLFDSPVPLGSQGDLVVYPCSGVHPSVNHFQRYSLKPFAQSKPNFVWSILGKEGGLSLYKLSGQMMTKMGVIYGKNL